MKDDVSKQKRRAREGMAASASFIAGVLLIGAAVMTFLLGYSAVFNNALFSLSPTWVFEQNPARWGWVHMALGIVMAADGFAVMFRPRWARVAAMALAAASMTLFLLWLPYYRLWSFVVIALDVAVISMIAVWAKPWSSPPDA